MCEVLADVDSARLAFDSGMFVVTGHVYESGTFHGTGTTCN